MPWPSATSRSGGVRSRANAVEQHRQLPEREQARHVGEVGLPTAVADSSTAPVAIEMVTAAAATASESVAYATSSPAAVLGANPGGGARTTDGASDSCSRTASSTVNSPSGTISRTIPVWSR